MKERRKESPSLPQCSIIASTKTDLNQEGYMKRWTVFSVVGIVAIVLAAPCDSHSQTRTVVDAGSTKQEKMMEALLDEVHRLRVAMQQITVNAYRGQVMVERLRLQQDQVDRLSRELEGVRNQIGDVRAAQVTGKDSLDEAEKQREVGMLAEAAVKIVRARFEDFKRQEQRLSERENQLAGDLAVERANLADLNIRLDALEREMVTTSLINNTKDNKKR